MKRDLKHLFDARYKVKCNTCNILLRSFNHEPNANKYRSVKNNYKSPHYKHDLVIVE